MRADVGLLLMALIWGVNFPVIKVSLDELPPLAFNALRFSLASLTVLCKLDDPAHQAARDKAKAFLLSIQNAEDPNRYDGGSWGYNSSQRGDLSNTQFTLEALKAAGLDENSDAFKEVVKFLSRSQNRSESSDFPDAGDDGGAMYFPGQSKAGEIELPNGKKIYKSYGSMTYALLRGYLLAGLKADDPRVQAAQKWITDSRYE